MTVISEQYMGCITVIYNELNGNTQEFPEKKINLNEENDVVGV